MRSSSSRHPVGGPAAAVWHGLVERCGCDVDRRGVYVVRTEAGERCHAEAVPTHRDVLARLLPASILSAVSSAG
jgi:hypothetical protein